MGKYIAGRNLGKNYRIEVYYFKDGYRLVPYRRKNGMWYEGSMEVFGRFDTLEEAMKEYREATPRMITLLSAGLR